MIEFSTEPPPMSTRERGVLVAASLLVAGTRLLALARGPWDWDEMLFLLGLREYDVASHHPHPPGFPLYMLMARVLVAAGWEPFRALQTLNLVAAIFAVPAMVFLCRELRLRFDVSLAAAVIFAFLPNVWFFGGTAFSDVPAIVLAVVASALLLRGARDASALVAGAVVLAIAAGFRPQNLLVCAVPAVIASWSQMRQRRAATVVGAIAAGFLVVVASYWGAIVATGEWYRYRDALLAHQQYLADVDSFRSATRPSLRQVFDDFFLRPFRFGAVNIVMALLAGASLMTAFIKRRWPVLIAVGMFGPFWILAWLSLDFHSAGRFSIGYMPLLAILCADGIAITVRGRTGLLAAAASVLVATMFVWAWPALGRVRAEFSPPLQAIGSLQHTRSTIYVQKRLRPYAEYYLPDHDLVHVEEHVPPGSRTGLFLREGGRGASSGTSFSWPRDQLWNIVRRRYFHVVIEPVTAGLDDEVEQRLLGPELDHLRDPGPDALSILHGRRVPRSPEGSDGRVVESEARVSAEDLHVQNFACLGDQHAGHDRCLDLLPCRDRGVHRARLTSRSGDGIKCVHVHDVALPHARRG